MYLPFVILRVQGVVLKWGHIHKYFFACLQKALQWIAIMDPVRKHQCVNDLNCSHIAVFLSNENLYNSND